MAKIPTGKQLGAVVAVVALAAAIALGAVRSLRKAPPPLAPREAAAIVAPVADDPRDPSFPTPELHQKYYGAVVQGEERGLQAVEAALGKLRREHGDAGQIAKLEAMRTDYQERLRRHRKKLER